jgi:hypothetical protein
MDELRVLSFVDGLGPFFLQFNASEAWMQRTCRHEYTVRCKNVTRHGASTISDSKFRDHSMQLHVQP